MSTATATRSLIDKVEVVRALTAIMPAGQVTELRALEATGPGEPRFVQTWSGYFNDPEKLAAAAASLPSFSGVYVIPNPVKPPLLARAVNRIRPVRKDPLTSDGDIAARRWLLIDCDAVRPAGIAASDAEHDAALERAAAIRSDLFEQDWPNPIEGDSGNGGHLLYPIDLSAEDGGLVQKCLDALAARYSDDVVRIDTTVHNPARIWRLYGAMNGKGDDAGEICGRPHRRARLLTVPTELEVTPTDLLYRLAESYQPEPPPEPTHHHKGNGSNKPFDLANWIRDHGLHVDGPESYTPKGGGTGQRWVFPACPWNPDHTNRSAFIIQFPSGKIDAGCHHLGCKGNKWRDLRQKFEPGYDPDRWERERRQRHNRRAADTPPPDMEEPPPPSKSKLPDIITAAALLDADIPDHHHVVEGMIRLQEVGTIVGGTKSRKSFFAMMLLLCVACGRAFLNRFPVVSGRVLLIDDEIQKSVIRKRLKAVALGMGITREEYESRIDVVSLRGRVSDMYDVGQLIRRNGENAYSLIVVDALYRLYPEGFDENSNADMTRLLTDVVGHAKAVNAAVLMVHHLSKGNQSGKAISDLGAGAGSLSRLVDFHFAMRPHEEPDCVVLEGIVRDFHDFDPIGLAWRYPLWTVDETLDVTKLAGMGGRPKTQKPPPDPKPQPMRAPEFVSRFVTSEPQNKAIILAKAQATGLTIRASQNLLIVAESEGLIFRWTIGQDHRVIHYATREQTVTETISHARKKPLYTVEGEQVASTAGSEACAKDFTSNAKTESQTADATGKGQPV